jgi:acyl carrier protein
MRDGQTLDQVSFLDIYRYIDVPVSEIYTFLATHAPWVRPDDTGRSTNCLINDAGIYVHRKREGFHNYALPYSWDVRLGHKTRDEALDELDDEIGYDDPIEPRAKPEIVCYVAADADVKAAELWDALRGRMLPEALPDHIVLLRHMPISNNGKVDGARLPRPDPENRAATVAYRAPQTSTERTLLNIFEAVLARAKIGIDDNFYDSGGDSLTAVQIAMRANAVGLNVPTTAVFDHPTIARLAASIKARPAPGSDDGDDDLFDLDQGDLDGITRALS